MAPSIGLNLRVTGYKHQGGRRYMEDDFGVAYQQTADEKDLEYAFFGIFDGHGGREAAVFAKEHLMDFIVSQKGFWEDDDDSVLKAIREGFIQTHYAMWKELEKWPKTASGLPSTAGTTASIAFIRRGKIYIGHVGDSAIVLGTQDPETPDAWVAEPLTIDHKPESIEESERIHQCGGKVICKSGVPRVVWNRPKMGHKGPVRRSTHIDEIPFLAVARSLGDLWSYNSEENVFVVSPEPDIRVYPVDITKHRCLILGTDGAWNMLTAQNAITTVCRAEKANEQHMLNPIEGKTCWINPSKQLVDTAIERWNNSKLRADNTSVVTVMLDPPGPPRAQVLKKRKRELAALNAGKDLPTPNHLIGDRGSVALVTNTTQEDRTAATASDTAENKDKKLERRGCSIISRFPNSSNPGQSVGYDLVKQRRRLSEQSPTNQIKDFKGCSGSLDDSTYIRPSTALPPVNNTGAGGRKTDDNVQCNEVSSSEDSPSHRSAPPSQRSSAAAGHSQRSAPSPSTAPRLSSPPVNSASNTPLTELKSEPSSSTGRNPPRTPSTPDLNSLQLTSPRTTRSRTRSENNHSDVENDQSGAAGSQGKQKRKVRSTPVPQHKSLSLVKLRCQEINQKIEKSQKAAEPPAPVNRPILRRRRLQPLPQEPETLHNLRSSSTPASKVGTPRTLRSGKSGSTATPSKPGATPKSALKRKSVVAAENTPPAKSPRTVNLKKPVVTRSRLATVLKLKK